MRGNRTTLDRLEAEIRALRSLLRVCFLCRKDLMRRYGVSESTLHRWMRTGGVLPDPVRLTGPRWRLSDLEAAEQAGRIKSRE